MRCDQRNRSFTACGFFSPFQPGRGPDGRSTWPHRTVPRRLLPGLGDTANGFARVHQLRKLLANRLHLRIVFVRVRAEAAEAAEVGPPAPAEFGGSLNSLKIRKEHHTESTIKEETCLIM